MFSSDLSYGNPVIRAALITLSLLCGACSAPQPAGNDAAARPTRIVSLDFCADQYVLKLKDRADILAVSADATAPFSYMKAAARGIPAVRSVAEDVLILEPDLIVRSYGGGPNAAAFFQSAGVPVINVGWAGDIDGIMRVTADMGEALGEPERARAIIDDMSQRLGAIKTGGPSQDALYLTPTGVTTGEGSLVHEMLLAAGLSNFQTDPGWRSLPLERLVYEKPGLIAAAFFGSPINNKDAWGSMAHPVAQTAIRGLPTAELEGAWTSCGAWFLMDAIEALAQTAALNSDTHNAR